MQTRPLGKTGLNLPILSFGASSLGAEFRSVKLDEALASVRVALDCGLNFIDTSPFYGRGMSEVLLGIALKGVPRDSYTLCTKLLKSWTRKCLINKAVLESSSSRHCSASEAVGSLTIRYSERRHRAAIPIAAPRGRRR